MSDRDLESFIEAVCGDSHLRVEDDLGDGFVRLRSAEAERRQAKHDIRNSEDIVIEMLRNARDADARHIFLAVSREENLRHLCFIDDGCGIPRHLWERIFEARVTSKLDCVCMDTWGIHGRGMALYAIAQNTKHASVVDSMIGGGTVLLVTTDIKHLPEKTDQSTHPTFIRTDQGTVSVRGPRNIIRTATEFAYIDRNRVEVFLGSPIEIAATLWEFGRAGLSPALMAFCDDLSTQPLSKRLAFAATPDDFAQIAHSIGLILSQRSARRIMDGEILPLSPLAENVNIRDSSGHMQKTKRKRTQQEQHAQHDALPPICGGITARPLRLSEEDRKHFTEKVAHAYQDLASAYYLAPDVEISLNIHRDGIHITIPIIPEP